MRKQLNRSVLKSLNPTRFGLKSEKKLLGQAQAKIFYFVSGRDRFRPKFQFLFGPEKTGPCRSLVGMKMRHSYGIALCIVYELHLDHKEYYNVIQ